MFVVTSGRWETEKSFVQSSKIFISERGTFGSSIQKGSTEIFEIMFFGYPNDTRSTEFSGFVAVMFSLGEIPRKPSDLSSSYLKNNVFSGPRAGSLAQNWIAEKKQLWSATFLVRCEKKLHFEIFSRTVLDCGTKMSLFNDKIQEESGLLVLNFCNGQKLV